MRFTFPNKMLQRTSTSARNRPPLAGPCTSAATWLQWMAIFPWRLDERRILATPTAMCKSMMKPSDLVIVRYGRPPSGRTPRRVRAKSRMHLLIYRLRHGLYRSGACASAHCHRFRRGAAWRSISRSVCEVVIGLGSIPLAKHGTPGTPELTAALEPLVPQYDAILASNHGVVAYERRPASRVHEEWRRSSTLPRSRWSPICSGAAQPLGSEELGKLMAARSRVSGIQVAASLPRGRSLCGRADDRPQPVARPSRRVRHR